MVLIPSSHQSGVNGIAVAPAPGGVPGRLLVASGGDDQALRVTLLSVTYIAGEGTTSTTAVAVARTASVQVDFAHSSAVKGVWMSGGVIATTSHDQRLRVWAAGVEDEPREGHAAGERSLSEREGAAAEGAEAGAEADAEAGAEAREGAGVSVTVAPVAGSFVECPEPEALDAWAEVDGGVRVAVSGRGVQMFHLR